MVVKPSTMNIDALTKMLTNELIFDIILVRELDITILVSRNLNTRWGPTFFTHMNILA
jgi:hypothetical protein